MFSRSRLATANPGAHVLLGRVFLVLSLACAATTDSQAATVVIDLGSDPDVVRIDGEDLRDRTGVRAVSCDLNAMGTIMQIW